MTFGVRKPSLKKSIKARTTGRVKRKVNSSINPLYGKKGTGYIKNPRRAVHNKLYRKTTVGANPLSGIGNTSDKHSYKSFQKNKQAIGFTKKERVELELEVTNVFERWVRRLLRKRPIETKIIQKDIITEQYTYEEMHTIESEAKEALNTYKQAMRVVSTTSDPNVFFPRLKEAETALSDVISYTKTYSFLIIEGEDIVETYHRFTQEKDNVIKQFVHNHFSDSLKGADSLKTNRGKKNRLTSDYTDLTAYFSDLSSSVIAMINSVWSTVVLESDLTKE
ncbi:MAG: hypothetical protein JJU16_04430 [Alkalibacterium sp.]|nr:hypothetical protein [Alkalibacterium sp.]